MSFLPTTTVYSSLNLAGLLHPAPGHGVRAVSLHASRRLLYSSRPSSRRSPDSPFTPSKAFPSYTAALRLRSRCLLAVSLVSSPFGQLTEVCRLPASNSQPASNTRVATSVFCLLPKPQPRGLAPCPSPLPTSVLPQLLARCSLGLCSPSGCSLRPRCPLLWTPRPDTISSEASSTFLGRLADSVPKHIAYRGLIRTGLSLTFQPCFTGADGTLRITASSYRDLPAVEVAFVPLALHIVSPKLNTAFLLSSSLPVPKHLPKTFLLRTKPAPSCLPAHRSALTDLPEH